VHFELQQRAVVLAVVVAVRGHHPDQVLGAELRGQMVAVPHAGREAPNRLVNAPPTPLVLSTHLEVLAGVDVCTVGDVGDAGALVRVAAAVLVIQAAIDAQETCAG
jgi:hypothetical protein